MTKQAVTGAYSISAFSLEPEEMASLVVETERAWQSLGDVRYGPTEAEKKSLIFRRSLYLAKDIAQGETFTAENVRIVRPGTSLHPRHYDTVLGKKAKTNLKLGQPLAWDMVG